MNECPCGSGQPFETCCAPFLAGTASPPTAEALMRSRYTAFTRGDVAYVERTLSSASRSDFDRAETEAWATGSQWLGLTVRACEGGGADDTIGTVEFVARYRFQGKDYAHHEQGRFEREDGAWVYADGIMNPKPEQRTVAKIGRNDPCSCGSGKKFKKCCGA